MAGIINEKPPVKVLNPEEQALIATCTGTAKSYTDATFKFRRQWYLNDNFYDGKHFVWWRKSTGTIDRIQPPKGSVLRSIPKASRQIDAVQNLITANRPRWVVYPEENVEGMVTEDAEKIAAKKRQWLEYQWDRNNMDEKIDDLVHYALKYPFSFFEVGFEKDMTVTVWDACDILYKPDVNSIYDSPMMVKSMRKSLKDVQKNPVYNENKMAIGTSQKFSADEMKDMRLAEKFGYIQGKEEQDGCLLQEFYLKEFVKDEMTGEEKQKIRIITIANEGVLLRNELTDLDEYPFALFSPKSGPYYQPASIERLMPPN